MFWILGFVIGSWLRIRESTMDWFLLLCGSPASSSALNIVLFSISESLNGIAWSLTVPPSMLCTLKVPISPIESQFTLSNLPITLVLSSNKMDTWLLRKSVISPLTICPSVKCFVVTRSPKCCILPTVRFPWLAVFLWLTGVPIFLLDKSIVSLPFLYNKTLKLRGCFILFILLYRLFVLI